MTAWPLNIGGRFAEGACNVGKRCVTPAEPNSRARLRVARHIINIVSHYRCRAVIALHDRRSSHWGDGTGQAAPLAQEYAPRSMR